MYFLNQANNPPKQRFIDPINDRYSTLPVYDETYFKDLYDIVSVEPVKEQDKVMMGMLASLGIQKGKPYAPDANTKKAMRQAAVDAWYYLQNWYDHVPSSQLYWPDRHYISLMQTDSNRTFTFVYPDRIDLMDRAAQFAWCTFVPKVLSEKPATEYLMAMADADGKPLEAGKLYKVDVPANMPMRQFWALSVYDRATFAFIYSNSGRTTLSSFDLPKMKKNADGGVTIYIGPKAPEGLESNWIPTTGKRPLPAMRIYGGTDDLFSRKFKMPDFVPVN
jgi:hypothetical protein